MKAQIFGHLIDLNKIYHITEIKESRTKWRGIAYNFRIYFLNRKKLEIIEYDMKDIDFTDREKSWLALSLIREKLYEIWSNEKFKDRIIIA